MLYLQGFSRFGVLVATPFLRHLRIDLYWVTSTYAAELDVYKRQVLALALFIGLFILLPTFIAGFLPKGMNKYLRSLVEGLMRIIICLLYTSRCV